ncbi:lysogenization regulator HflD [Pokkaliibacter plantistimulans]|uniref:Lysogenization regulator HflD n=1 Tax=Proteobacteria bacterium 228 TaxID=2083153 RepID=A0A2S5KQU2_9PROT|nr:high frequency lysogenization protein HflD [Pokkaliibacter plantistimulans]PPC77063.1 lysogenization regulator HflD [Pokkaliibacter plantistimulans]
MATPYESQAMALAAVFQVARLVDDIAKRNSFSPGPFETSIGSLFVMSPDKASDVYGNYDELHFSLAPGLRELRAMLEKDTDQNRDIIRYAISLLHLERKLDRRGDMLGAIASKMPDIERQASFFADDEAQSAREKYCHANVLAALAGLYQDTLSTFTFRIQVAGNPANLRDSQNVNRIRALLLAGIRAARQWRQLGGRRWQLIFSRSKLLDACKKLQGSHY